MQEIKFYKFRKECVNGMLVNGKYKVKDKELKELIDNIVLDLEEVSKDTWKLVLEENVFNSNIIYIEKA